MPSASGPGAKVVGLIGKRKGPGSGLVEFKVVWEDGREKWELRKDLVSDGLKEHVKAYDEAVRNGGSGWFSEDYGKVTKKGRKAAKPSPAKSASRPRKASVSRGRRKKTPEPKPEPEPAEEEEGDEKEATDEVEAETAAGSGVSTMFGAATRVRFHGGGRLLSPVATAAAAAAAAAYAAGWGAAWASWVAVGLAAYHVVFSSASGDAWDPERTRMTALFFLLAVGAFEAGGGPSVAALATEGTWAAGWAHHATRALAAAALAMSTWWPSPPTAAAAAAAAVTAAAAVVSHPETAAALALGGVAAPEGAAGWAAAAVFAAHAASTIGALAALVARPTAWRRYAGLAGVVMFHHQGLVSQAAARGLELIPTRAAEAVAGAPSAVLTLALALWLVAVAADDADAPGEEEGEGFAEPAGYPM